jgi:hypothetical protein
MGDGHHIEMPPAAGLWETDITSRCRRLRVYGRWTSHRDAAGCGSMGDGHHIEMPPAAGLWEMDLEAQDDLRRPILIEILHTITSDFRGF